MSATPARHRHGREIYSIEGEGTLDAATGRMGRLEADAAPAFRFSRMGPTGTKVGPGVRGKVARAMIEGEDRDGDIPAGYTYLGQFVDHDLTFDKTTVMLGENISPADLLQGRSPTLDLDSVYGAGPADPESRKFYADDMRLKVGRTTAIDGDVARTGFDVPRGLGSTVAAKRKAVIPDHRNDENLAVAQHHLAFIRLHNKLVGRTPAHLPAAERFTRARRRAILHYQWMLRTDYLPRIADKAVVEDVFRNGRKVFEPAASPLSLPTMPIEFSVAAFRLGHSMVRATYDWNARFPDGSGSLDLLFLFSATSGDLGGNPTLPSNWIADWRRLYRFREAGRTDLNPPAGEFNLAHRIDTRMVDPLSLLPPGSFGGTDDDAGRIQANLAFRNLTRASMLSLASGQQMAAFLRSKGVSVPTLTAAQVRDGLGGTSLASLSAEHRAAFVARTPLWFYVLREAELNGGRLTGVGARIVAETFHRAMEGSRFSIVRSPEWRPNLGAVDGRFLMPDLLLFAFNGKKSELAPLG